MLVNMREMLQDAERNNYAIGSLNTPNLETLRAVISAAEKLNCPIIINQAQGSESVVSIETIAPLMKMYAEQAKVPVAMHIDHGLDINYCLKAIRYGFTSIMYDRSEDPFEVNVNELKKFVDLARPLGITVEAELGAMPSNMPAEVPGHEKSDLSDLTKYFTKVDEAKAFTEKTGVDVLTISFGTVHGVYEKKSNLDIDRVAAIKKAISNTNTYLGMHGASGTEPFQITKAINAGINKINYFTGMDTAPTKVLVDYMREKEGRKINFSVLSNIIMEELEKNALTTLELFLNGYKR